MFQHSREDATSRYKTKTNIYSMLERLQLAMSESKKKAVSQI